jgi:hypothetical protein
MMKNYTINKLTVVLSAGDNERVLRGSGALGSFSMGSSSAGVFRGSCFFKLYDVFILFYTLLKRD